MMNAGWGAFHVFAVVILLQIFDPEFLGCGLFCFVFSELDVGGFGRQVAFHQRGGSDVTL